MNRRAPAAAAAASRWSVPRRAAGWSSRTPGRTRITYPLSRGVLGRGTVPRGFALSDEEGCRPVTLIRRGVTRARGTVGRGAAGPSRGTLDRNRGEMDKIRSVTAPYRARTLRRLGPGIVLAIFVVLLVAVPKTPGTLRPTPVLSSLESSGQVSLAGDCGYSSPLPSEPASSLWLFCDTPVYVRKTDRDGRSSWSLQRVIEGSTAAVSSPGSAGRAPGELSEVATPADPGRRATRAGAAPPPFLAPAAGPVMP